MVDYPKDTQVISRLVKNKSNVFIQASNGSITISYQVVSSPRTQGPFSPVELAVLLCNYMNLIYFIHIIRSLKYR